MIVPTVERGLRDADFWSIEMAGESPSMKSTSGLSIWPEELPGVARQRLHVPPLPLGVDGVEGERALPRPGQPGEDDQPVAGQLQGDVAQVVLAGARGPPACPSVQARLPCCITSPHRIRLPANRRSTVHSGTSGAAARVDVGYNRRMPIRPHVVIVGSGFGGLNAATRLAPAPVDITVVDRDNYHGFWPLLYQVATAGLGADDIAHPIRSIYSRYPNIRCGSARSPASTSRTRRWRSTASPVAALRLPGPGGRVVDQRLRDPGVAEHAFPLKTLPDAVRLRNHVLSTFEQADAAGRRPAAGAR